MDHVGNQETGLFLDTKVEERHRAGQVAGGQNEGQTTWWHRGWTKVRSEVRLEPLAQRGGDGWWWRYFMLHTKQTAKSGILEASGLCP